MPADGHTLLRDHGRACDRFSEVVAGAKDRWDWPSPCPGWNAKGVVEHVIGFHDVLILVPFGAKPHRPKNDPRARWEVSEEAIFGVLSDDRVIAEPVAVPSVGQSTGTTMALGPLLAALTSDVLIHTWDLAKAVKCDTTLDPELCEHALARGRQSEESIRRSGMYGPPVEVASDSDVASRMLGFFGRDPGWQPPGPR